MSILWAKQYLAGLARLLAPSWLLFFSARSFGLLFYGPVQGPFYVAGRWASPVGIRSACAGTMARRSWQAPCTADA